MFEKIMNTMFGSSKLGGNDETKGLLQSKTFYGVMLILVGYGASYFELDLGEPGVAEVVENILTGLGTVLALYGRIKAVKGIG